MSSFAKNPKKRDSLRLAYPRDAGRLEAETGTGTGKLVWSSVLECRARQRNNLARSGSRAAKGCVVGAKWSGDAFKEERTIRCGPDSQP